MTEKMRTSKGKKMTGKMRSSKEKKNRAKKTKMDNFKVTTKNKSVDRTNNKGRTTTTTQIAMLLPCRKTKKKRQSTPASFRFRSKKPSVC